MINTADASAPATAAQPTPSKSQTRASIAASDFQSFLSLLTAQLRNQDPLSPLDSTQFVEQLATFSSVEQQIETNRLLEKLAGGGGMDLETATLWIGKEIEAQSAALRYTGAPLKFSVPINANATAADIVVRDSSGAVIRRSAIAAGQSAFEWNGENSSGAAAPAGDYSFTVEYPGDDGAVESRPLNAISRVVEARLVDGSLRLVLSNGSLIDPASISAVRAPASDVLAGDI